MLNPQTSSLSHEELFAQRYEWLRGWALQLTEHNHEQAEDLVHDVFIHFTISRPDLDAIQHNLEGYLYTMLRNMHVSQVRRAARIRHTIVSLPELSLLDYDSVEKGLRAVDQIHAQTQIQVQDELQHICHYACLRKETSKAGSVLILRFFHGYYPCEIAQILRSPRGAVDEWLSVARCEAKIYLSNPRALSFIVPGSRQEIARPASKPTTEDFLHELHHAIWGSQARDCLSLEKLQALYRATGNASIDCANLAHIVSCAHCLDEVNKVLDLPLLSSRYPTNTLGKDPRRNSKPGGGEPGGKSGASSIGEFINRSRRRMKDVLEHRPQELRISVNGFVLGSHTVSSKLSKQTIRVKGDERIGFVEVFSEEEVRMLFCSVEPPPDGPVERQMQIDLSDGRRLELELNFNNPWPSLHVVYHDPTFIAEVAPQLEIVEGPAAPTISVSAEKLDRATLWARVLNLMSQMRRSLFATAIWLRPDAVTAILSIILISALLLMRLPEPSRVSAAELLYRSAASEVATAERPDTVLRRTITLEERRFAGSEVVVRRKVEVWRTGEKGTVARRLFDEKNRLVAGERTSADGSRTIYQHNSKPRVESKPASQSDAPLALDNVWQLEPSASDFTALVKYADAAHVEERGAAYVISYGSEASFSARGLVKATLVLNRADLRAIEQTLVTQQGAEVREYRFTEVAFERKPVNAVAPAVFEIEADFPSVTVSPAKLKDKNPKAENQPAPTAEPTRPVALVRSADLEVEVTYLLNEIKANLGEQVSLMRSPEGGLRIEGIIDTEQRKAEIIRALAPVSSNPAVKVDVLTVAEASKRQSHLLSSPAITSRIEVAKGAIPVDPQLRRYFSAREVPSDRLDQEISQFGNRMIRRVRQAQLHAWALKRLIERFTPEDLRMLGVEAKAKRLLMIRDHALNFERETRMLRQELEPVFFSTASPGGAKDQLEIKSESDLARAVARLFQLGSAHQRVVYSSFSISADHHPVSSDVKTPQFWFSLREAETLAATIQSAP
ncbi:MAG: RNA polymerase sigma factor [Acidobacteriota bacterium]|nr:RNA polymerase sigma factor [Acidobacteriota bacterium]